MVDYQKALWTPSGNYWVGRSGYQPRFIVAHGTAGAMPGALDWLTSTQSGASVHYMVDRQGLVYQLVPEACAAWGNGIPEPDSTFLGGPNPNLTTISCEAERDTSNASPITAPQQAALVALFADIRRRHGPLPLIPHSAISPQSRAHCPGDGYPLEAIDRASALPPAGTPPQGSGLTVTWVRFDATPQRLPLVFYREASFAHPLYPSSATKNTTLHFGAWTRGPAVRDPATGQADTRWYKRFNPHGNEGWTPSAWVIGNPESSSP